MSAAVRQARTSVLDIVYEDNGLESGAPVFLMHGWPYGPRVYDAVVARLVEAGCRAIVPLISVPTIVLHGEANGVTPPLSERQRRKFSNLVEDRRIPRVGHNLPSEAPDVVADAVLALLKR